MDDDDSYRVTILDANGKDVPGNFFLSEDTSSDRISLKLDFEGQSIVKTADDYFEAMCEIRRELEKKNLKLNCYGASKNVYPSGMCRDMGSRCAPEQSQEEAEAVLRHRRSLSYEEQVRENETHEWSLSNWIYWFRPENRVWVWWDACIEDPNTVRVIVETAELPFPYDALGWLFRASGATQVEPEL